MVNVLFIKQGMENFIILLIYEIDIECLIITLFMKWIILWPLDLFECRDK